MNLTIPEMKLLWIVGAAERLATLGMLSPDIPLKLSADAVDNFIEIDEHRNLLFPNDFEIAQIFKAIARSENEFEVEEKEINQMLFYDIIEPVDKPTEWLSQIVLVLKKQPGEVRITTDRE